MGRSPPRDRGHGAVSVSALISDPLAGSPVLLLLSFWMFFFLAELLVQRFFERVLKYRDAEVEAAPDIIHATPHAAPDNGCAQSGKH